jgi:hypothetical protein
MVNNNLNISCRRSRIADGNAIRENTVQLKHISPLVEYDLAGAPPLRICEPAMDGFPVDQFSLNLAINRMTGTFEPSQ